MAKSRKLVEQIAKPIQEQDQSFFIKIDDVDWLGNVPGNVPDDLIDFEAHVRYSAAVDARSWGIKDIDYFLQQAVIMADGETVATITPADWTVKFELQRYAPAHVFIEWDKKIIEFS